MNVAGAAAACVTYEAKAKLFEEKGEFGLAFEAWFDALEAGSVLAETITLKPFSNSFSNWREVHETEFFTLLDSYKQRVTMATTQHDSLLSNLCNRLGYLYSNAYGLDSSDGLEDCF